MEPARTCIGCRSRDDRSALVRIVAREGVVVPDPSGALPGRGAWVHPTGECVNNSIKRKAFGRALRVSTPLDPALLIATVDGSSEPSERTG